MSESPSENEQDGIQEIKLPPKPLPEVESSFIRSEIQSRDFALEQDRAYIASLVKIKEYVLNPPDGFGGGVHCGKLRNRYPEAFDHIQRELDPESFANRKQREHERERQRNERQQPTAADVRDRLAQYREQWAAVHDENAPGGEV